MKKFLHWLFSRAIICYLITGLMIAFCVDHKRIVFGLKIRILDNTMPNDFSTLIMIDQSPSLTGPFPKDKLLNSYARWYSQIVSFFPEEPDARALFAYCLYFLGDYDQSLQQYRKAYELNNQIFWFPYNMGVIYYKSGKYKEAAEKLTESFKKDPQTALDFIVESTVVYRSIFNQIPDWPKQLEPRLKRAYGNAYVLLCISYYRLSDYKLMQSTALHALTRNIGNRDIFSYYAGVAAYKQNNLTQAESLFAQSIKLNPAVAKLLAGKREPPLLIKQEQFLKMY